MASSSPPCVAPPNAAAAGYPPSYCACPPGYYLSRANGSSSAAAACQLYAPSGEDDMYFVPGFDTAEYVSNVSYWQNLWLYITMGVLGFWMLATLLLRLAPLTGVWFKLRRFVSMVDYAFSKKHWNDVQKVVVKRKTELGGMLSIGAFIFIIGLALGEFFAFITQKSMTVQTILPTSGSDVVDFYNTLDYNLTVVSGMTCAQFNISMENHVQIGAFDLEERTIPATAVNSSCTDSPLGPIVRMQCNQCQIAHNDYYVRWYFDDRPDLGLVASAVGFDLSIAIISKNRERSCLLTQSVRPTDFTDTSMPVTIRGGSSSVLSVRFIPRVFPQDNNLKLMQVTYQDFVPAQPLLNTTEAIEVSLATPQQLQLVMHTQVASAYLVETTVIPTTGIITLLSRIGGLYQLGVFLFFTCLNMSERFFKFLRYDDKLLNRLEKQRLARYHWNKLRIAVKYGFFAVQMKQQQQAEEEAAAAAATESEPLMGGEEKGTDEKGKEARGRWAKLAGVFAPLHSFFNRKATEEKQKGREGGSGEERTSQNAVEGLVVETVERPEGGEERSVSSSLKASVSKSIGIIQKGVIENGKVPVQATTKLVGEIKTQSAKALALQKSLTSSIAHVQPPGIEDAKEGEGADEKKKSKKKKKKKKIKGSHLDNRLGSQSQHEGMIVQKIRKPSWIREYEMLPAPPEMAEAAAKRKQMEEQADAEVKGDQSDGTEGAAAVPPVEVDDDSSDDDRVDVEEVYDHLVDLYEYQDRFRMDFLLAQSMLENVVQRFRPHTDL